MNGSRHSFLVASLTAALISVAASHSAVGVEPPTQAELSTELDQLRVQLKVPGVVVGVYRSAAEPVRLALGMADVEQKLPMRLDCSFRVASLTKVFVGQVVLQLAGEGKVSIEDPISKFVSGVPHGDRITLRHLGNQRSGLFNPIESREVQQAFASNPTRLWTEAELLAFSFKNPVQFEPGAEHHYSNANTVLLAHAIEKVTGNSWKSEIKERILRPLGMAHTVIPDGYEMPAGHAEGYALGSNKGPFFNRGDKLFRVTNTSPTWWGPAGSMISTLDDLHRAAKPLATGRLLPAEQRAELHRWTATDQSGFEYGFHIERVRGAIGHDGDVPGFQSVMLYFPEKDATVIALGNLYGWSVVGMPANQVAWRAAERLLDVPPKR